MGSPHCFCKHALVWLNSVGSFQIATGQYLGPLLSCNFIGAGAKCPPFLKFHWPPLTWRQEWRHGYDPTINTLPDVITLTFLDKNSKTCPPSHPFNTGKVPNYQFQPSFSLFSDGPHAVWPDFLYGALFLCGLPTPVDWSHRGLIILLAGDFWLWTFALEGALHL